jgi:hypothetical protein
MGTRKFVGRGWPERNPGRQAFLRDMCRGRFAREVREGALIHFFA